MSGAMLRSSAVVLILMTVLGLSAGNITDWYLYWGQFTCTLLNCQSYWYIIIMSIVVNLFVPVCQCCTTNSTNTVPFSKIGLKLFTYMIHLLNYHQPCMYFCMEQTRSPLQQTVKHKVNTDTRHTRPGSGGVSEVVLKILAFSLYLKMRREAEWRRQRDNLLQVCFSLFLLWKLWLIFRRQ